MKVEAQPRDTQEFVVGFLRPLLAPAATCGRRVPPGWEPTSTPHLQVLSDGDPIPVWPIATRSTIQLVARAETEEDAIDLCGLAFGLLCAHNGDEDIVQTRPLTGVLAARDFETRAELASATVRVTVRTEPIDTGS